MISSYDLRKIILEQSHRAHVGHIGSELSIADILVALYGHILDIPQPDDPARDRFILSKGHAALALYGIFFLKGWITKAQLDTYCANDSLLGVHPEHTLKGVDFSTGSLGHGLSIGVGAALAARMKKLSYRTFVLLSDAECNEGSLWEAVMFAAHHKLSNLVAILDANNQQALDFTKNVIDLHPLEERFKSFGWDVHVADGHDVEQMVQAIKNLRFEEGPPHMMIANTTFGKGVSYMTNTIKWHYMPMSDQEYAGALQEIEEQK